MAELVAELIVLLAMVVGELDMVVLALIRQKNQSGLVADSVPEPLKLPDVAASNVKPKMGDAVPPGGARP